VTNFITPRCAERWIFAFGFFAFCSLRRITAIAQRGEGEIRPVPNSRGLFRGIVPQSSGTIGDCHLCAKRVGDGGKLHFRSNGMSESRRGRERVAIKIIFALSVSRRPSSRVTVTEPLPSGRNSLDGLPAALIP
jgi:hypothetical protein